MQSLQWTSTLKSIPQCCCTAQYSAVTPGFHSSDNNDNNNKTKFHFAEHTFQDQGSCCSFLEALHVLICVRFQKLTHGLESGGCGNVGIFLCSSCQDSGRQGTKPAAAWMQGAEWSSWKYVVALVKTPEIQSVRAKFIFKLSSKRLKALNRLRHTWTSHRTWVCIFKAV